MESIRKRVHMSIFVTKHDRWNSFSHIKTSHTLSLGLNFQSHRIQPLPVRAMASISTGTPLGSSFTATHDRDGLCVKYFSYTEFISAKFSMVVRKTVTYEKCPDQTYIPNDMTQGGTRSDSRKAKGVTYLHTSADGATGILEDVLEPLAARGRLVGNAAFDQLALSRGGDLAGDEDVRAGDDGLGVRADRYEILSQRLNS